MKATLPGGHPKSIEDLLNEFEWKFSGLRQISQTTMDLDRQLKDPTLRQFLGMRIHAAKNVQILVDEYDEMRELIFQRLDRNDREVKPDKEANDAS